VIALTSSLWGRQRGFVTRYSLHDYFCLLIRCSLRDVLIRPTDPEIHQKGLGGPGGLSKETLERWDSFRCVDWMLFHDSLELNRCAWLGLCEPDREVRFLNGVCARVCVCVRGWLCSVQSLRSPDPHG
jgi:hypothetical protein